MTDAPLGWLSCALTEVPDDDDWLSPREQTVLADLRFAPRRLDWRLGRWTAKRAVGAWLEARAAVRARPEAVEILAADDGAPEALLDRQAAPVAVSLSHRQGLAVCAVAPAGTAVGCDLEAVESRGDVFIRDWFTAEEQAVVDAAPPARRPLLATLIWSGKESASKALREGLRLDTRELAVRLGTPFGNGGDQAWRTFSVVATTLPCAFTGFWRRHRDHVLTVVAPARCERPPVPLGHGERELRRPPTCAIRSDEIMPDTTGAAGASGMAGSNGRVDGPVERVLAVIFDTDGVVTRTATVHAAAWKALFDEYLRRRADATGEPFLVFDDEDYVRYVDGRSRYRGVEEFLASRGIVLPPGEPGDAPDRETICGLGNRKNEHFLAQVRDHGVEPFHSTLDLARRLRRRGIGTAVVSASENCAAVLDAAGATPLFDARVDGLDAAALGLASKPDPALFLEAARRLDTPPARAAVVEDALAGVQAGRRGGFGLVVGVDRTGHADALVGHGADVVVADLAELDIDDTGRWTVGAGLRGSAETPGVQ